LVADGRDDTEDDVVDPVGVEVGVAGAELANQPDDEVDRLDLVQGAVGLALASRGAEVVVHECFCHRADCDSNAVTVKSAAV
jgi:hypothetical protein